MASNPSASACCANSTAFAAGGMIRPGAPSVTRIGSMPASVNQLRRKIYQPSGRFCYACAAMLSYRTEGPIAWARLDRPEKLNAMTRSFWDDLQRVLDQAE